MRGLCTLRELEEYYSIDDLADMVEAIEYSDACQEISMNKSQSEPEQKIKTIKIDGKSF